MEREAKSFEQYWHRLRGRDRSRLFLAGEAGAVTGILGLVEGGVGGGVGWLMEVFNESHADDTNIHPGGATGGNPIPGISTGERLVS